ncbi:MAG: hypothetical protein V4574_09640 [Pseudomonadota bacterium]
MRLLLIRAALLLAAPGIASQKHSVPEATPAGKPVTCLSLGQIRETRVRSDEVIDFYVGGGKVYRNTLPHKCPGLGFEERYAHKTSIGQICSVDTITVLQSPGITQGASCGLGTFQPVTLADGTR